MGCWLLLSKRDADAIREGPTRAQTSEQPLENKYGGSKSCEECHEDEYRLWARSHHALAERRPQAALDDPAFDSKSPAAADLKSVSVSKAGNDFSVQATGLSGSRQSFQVQYVIGESPLRQYLVPVGQGRLQALEASYDPRSNEWFNVFGSEGRHPGEWGHWTGRGMNWNSMCADCHNTRLEKNYSESEDVYHTTMAERAVGCEACHGPLDAHNRWQKQFGRSHQTDPTIRHLTKNQAVDNCGFCHARRGELTGDFKPGDDFLDDMRPVVVDASSVFYADGQVREEDYEYASFLSSRMHFRGVHCMDCHDPHSAKTILPGNWLCMRCHNGSYTNAPLIEPVTHSHHKVFGYDASGKVLNTDLSSYSSGEVKETGGECVNCHMPQTVYMQRHWRHDHGFTIPDPLLTKQEAIPNACNRCHRDKSTDWALDNCQKWYGPKMDRPSRQRALVVAAARKGKDTARLGLLELLAKEENPYWRAVAAGLLTPWAEHATVRDTLLKGLSDTNSLVRLESVEAVSSLVPMDEVAAALRRRLNDPVRAVRLSAAWALRGELDISSAVGSEFMKFLAINSDQPAGKMQQAAFEVSRNDLTNAVRHYQKAVEWDPNSAVIRHDYAIALSGLSRMNEAVEQLQAACRLEPTNADWQYKLALGWNELGQADRAIEGLQMAVRLDPGYAKAWYNLGLALSSAGRAEEAIRALESAESADRSDPRCPYARATILARLGALEQARQAAQRALTIDPKFEPARELLKSLP